MTILVECKASADMPRKLGPFVIDGILGRGGMGIVYSASHSGTGKAVAIKTLRSSAPSMLSAIRREIHALQRLNHPIVVRIVDHGVTEGVPWYAMELLRGSTLRQHIDAAHPLLGVRSVLTAAQSVVNPTETGAAFSNVGRRSETRMASAGEPRAARLGGLLRLVRRTCAGLGHVHASGVVHRDLKPENVFIRDTASPVLVDFGIATRFGGARGREVLHADTQVIGTVAYMAPEQIRGELLDARTDLYSIGCILYECLTGLPPFAGIATSGVLHAHLHRTPLPPSELAAGIEPALDCLVLQLLEKEPRNRLGYASDVVLALDAAFPELASDEPPAAGSTYIYRPPFVGREADRSRLSDAIRALIRDGKGGLFYLAGESGVGKTRLAMEAAQEATRQGLTVVVSTCGVEGPGDEDLVHLQPLAPFAPMLLAMVDHCRESGAAESERIFGVRGKVLSHYQDAITSLTDFQGWAEPSPLTGTAAGQRVLAALVDSLFAYVQARPSMLVIDDLQWGDELSKSLLEQLSRHDLEERGLLLLVTYRAEEASSELRQLATAPNGALTTLARFGERDVSAMAEGILGVSQLSASLQSHLHRQSGGNPFFVVEYLRAAIAAGSLTRAGAGGWRETATDRSAIDTALIDLAVPASIASLMERRLRDLDERARTLLRRAAVLGREFDGDVLLELAALPPALAMDSLDELRRRQILEETEAGTLRFAHDRLRAAAYATIEDHELPGLHQEAAVILERRLPRTPSFGQRAGLAAHWSRAGLPSKARHYFQHAAEHAYRMYAHADAISLYQACLREAQLEQEQPGGDTGETTGPLHEAVGAIYSLLGRRSEAKAAYDLALLVSDSARTRARLWRRIGKTYETQHLQDEALSAYSEAEGALGEPPTETDDEWWSEWIGLQIDRVMVHYWLAREVELEKLTEAIRAVATKHRNPQQRAQLFKSLAYVNLRRERYALSEQTVSYAEERLRASREWGDDAEILEARFMLAMVLLCHGALDRAEREIMAALPEAEQRGDVTILARFLAYLTVTKRRTRDLEGTRDSATKCLDVATAASLREYVGAARANLAWVAWRNEDYARATHECDAALEAWRAISFVYPFE